MERQAERDRFLYELMNELFFKGWRGEKEDEYHDTIEFQVSYSCIHNCSYCYVNHYGDELYKPDIQEKDRVIENTKLLLDWIEANGFHINTWSLFSGSLFSQKVGYEVIEIIYNKLRNTDKEKIKPNVIMIPNNMTFLMDDESKQQVEEYIEKFKELGIKFHLSNSVEGKYMNENTPVNMKVPVGDKMGEHLFRPNEIDDSYYDDVFKFAKEHGYGFHPMIYSNNIEKWKKNFLWFQDKFEEYGLPHNRIFLLEVRNEEWSDREIKELRDFVTFVHHWVYQNIARGDKEKFFKLIDNSNTINMVYSLVGQNKLSGMPCSIQSDIQVRLGDLHFGPCHRTSYTGYEFGKFSVENGAITGIDAINPELAMGVYSLDHETVQGCMTCPINAVCNKTCLGANMESTGEPFTPSPKVCQLGYAKALGALDFYKDIGSLNDVKQHSNGDVYQAYKKLEEISGEEE